jgi:hypothetical protein
MLHLRNAVLQVLFKVNQCLLNPNPPDGGLIGGIRGSRLHRACLFDDSGDAATAMKAVTNAAANIGNSLIRVALSLLVSLMVVRRRDDRRYSRPGENIPRRSHVHVIRRRTFGVTLPRPLSIELAGYYPPSTA